MVLHKVLFMSMGVIFCLEVLESNYELPDNLDDLFNLIKGAMVVNIISSLLFSLLLII